MRTQGSFSDIWEAAKEHYNEDHAHCPHDPVVRYQDGTWAIESGIESADCDVEVPLGDFHDWFGGYDTDLTDNDEAEFISQHT